MLSAELKLLAWEVTRRCNLDCAHCRAASRYGEYPGELTREAGFRLLDELVSLGRPIVILTGGEPLLRPDIFELASYGSLLGLRMVLATNATLVTDETARKLMEAGIKRVSVSIDGPEAESHDSFRRVPGAFAGALAGIAAMKRVGLEFQINTTITRGNLPQIEDIHRLAISLGAVAHHIFLLVPTGRGREMAAESISQEAYEKTLEWFVHAGESCSIQLKATCAPHYFRILHQKGKQQQKRGGHPFHSLTRGCMGGSSFCFISHTGQAQPCGYLEVDCGLLVRQSFREIWSDSPVFNRLRQLDLYGGKCGACEFLKICGGCRARAYEETGDYLAEEPFCLYQPRAQDYGRGTGNG
jgi:heme b synthase